MDEPKHNPEKMPSVDWRTLSATAVCAENPQIAEYVARLETQLDESRGPLKSALEVGLADELEASVANERHANAFMKASRELAEEKMRRIYYQTIVYDCCNLLDTALRVAGVDAHKEQLEARSLTSEAEYDSPTSRPEDDPVSDEDTNDLDPMEPAVPGVEPGFQGTSPRETASLHCADEMLISPSKLSPELLKDKEFMDAMKQIQARLPKP